VSILQGAERVAVLRALPGLGDLLCAVPALRSLRGASPGAEVTLVGLPSSAWFPDRFPELVDRLMPLPHWPGIPEATDRADLLPGFLERARARRFDVAVQLHGTGSCTNDLVAALGAAVTAGHHVQGRRAPDARTYRPWPSRGHEIDRLLEMILMLGGADVPAALSWTERSRDLEEASPVRAAVAGRPYACLHPGASRPDRRWSWRGFAEVARGLADRQLTVVLTGTATERELALRVAAAADVPAVIAAGDTSLGALGAILRRSELVIANDTGAAHLAVAVSAPTVVVVTTSDADRWAPKDRVAHRVVLAAARGPGGRGDPSPAAVLDAAGELLAAR
jgi:ADP-heptose:LPS heptosyltransferase